MKTNPMTWLMSLAVPLLLVGFSPMAAPPSDGPFVEPEVEVLHTFEGENIGDRFGWAAENLGDLNGDGVNDFIISAILNSDNGFHAGKAYVYSGANFELVMKVANVNSRLSG